MVARNILRDICILDLSEAQHMPSSGQSMEEMSFVDSINNAENCGFDSGMI